MSRIRESYTRAAELNPDDANAWNGKGIVLGSLDREEEALLCFDKAVEMNPLTRGRESIRALFSSNWGVWRRR